MNSYEERKQRRKEKLINRASRLREFANKNGLELFGEEKSGIPLGQPILVGHHSEKRHRKHLERINNRVRKGYEAHDKADRLERAIEAIEDRKSIDSDNPEAINLIKLKIQELEQARERSKSYNTFYRQTQSVEELAKLISAKYPEASEPLLLASHLVNDKGVPRWFFTNIGCQINRYKKRLVQLEKMNSQAFKSIEKNGIKIELIDSRIEIDFGNEKPSEEFRNKLKCSPLAFKWSPTVKKWVRKHTPTTNSQYFKSELLKFAQEFENAGK